ncbi:hypothetical protein OBBRIDRAFT_828694 [Obba rivulosa]|uniref:Uncharacterized protein n=1 Tax=Obba rivulosa TaxID=1052685 RepID=A0A8E2AKE2_9APHY|nr:hypothetical protein OBBRIDRAFT_828694 [Obba rivulosa]
MYGKDGSPLGARDLRGACEVGMQAAAERIEIGGSQKFEGGCGEGYPASHVMVTRRNVAPPRCPKTIDGAAPCRNASWTSSSNVKPSVARCQHAMRSICRPDEAYSAGGASNRDLQRPALPFAGSLTRCGMSHLLVRASYPRNACTVPRHETGGSGCATRLAPGGEGGDGVGEDIALLGKR